jgi:Holliday junction resolvase-like predicted endonuclease
LLEDAPAVRRTLALYQDAMGHPVYLRPTQKGLAVMSLDPTAPSLVGPAGSSECYVNALPPEPGALEAAVLAYRAKVASMKRRPVEERYVLGRVRKALESGLDLGGDLLLLHQQWRSSGSGEIDVIALDRQTGQLVVAEAKSSEVAALDRATAEQVRAHVEELTAHAAECMPFFQRLASALARIYCPDGDQPSINANRAPRSEIWWPEGRIRQSSQMPKAT